MGRAKHGHEHTVLPGELEAAARPGERDGGGRAHIGGLAQAATTSSSGVSRRVEWASLGSGPVATVVVVEWPGHRVRRACMRER